MLFIEIIKYVLESLHKNINYTEKEIKILNYVIFSICQRLLIIMTKLTEHCNRTIIKDTYVNYSMNIEFNEINYDLSDIKINKQIKHSLHSTIRNIYHQKVASVYEITKNTVDLLSIVLYYLINYFINESNKNGSINYHDILHVLKKNNLSLYNNLLVKYHLKK